MLVFPQLTTGAAVLYPLLRRTERRTVVNTLADGRRVVYADLDGAARRWEVQATGLRQTEMEAIEALFDVVKGPLETFTFLEPAGNLLARSEEFGAPEWDNDPLVGTTAGIDDPFGGMQAMTVLNASGVAVGGVKQTLAVPGNFRYAMSVWARGSEVTLTAASASRAFTLTPEWRRIFFPVDLQVEADSVTFGAVLAAGGAADLFGMQVEAQLGVSAYQKTGARGGVHSHARFAGEISVRAQGTDVFDALIQIIGRE